MKDKEHIINYVNSLTDEQKNTLIIKLLVCAHDSEWVDWYYDEDEDPKFRIYWEDNGEDLV